MKSPGCDHCSHPLFAGVRCDLCGREAGQLHTCSYSCTRPACVLAQRDELRARVEDSQAAATFFANSRQADEALMLQALEALQDIVRHQEPEQYVEREVALRKARASITALRERLEGKK